MLAYLLAAQTRADEVSKELRTSGGEVERLHERLQTAERRWQLVHSPQAYLVGQLRNAEEAAEAAVAQQRSAARTLRENDATLTDVREQHRLLQARHLDITPLARAAPAQSSQHACGTCGCRLEHIPLQADLERLLQKRGSFDALRGTLSRLIAKEQQDPNPKGGSASGGAGAGSGAGSRAGGRAGASLSNSSSFGAGAPPGGLRSSSSGQGAGGMMASLVQPSRRG